MSLSNGNFEYIQLRITESFSRVLETWNDKTSRLSLETNSGHHVLIFKHSEDPAKYFRVDSDPPLKDYFPLACCTNNGEWEHVGEIGEKLRMTATDDSFDQVRQNLVKVDHDSRKTNFPPWVSVSGVQLKKKGQKSSRSKVAPLRKTPLASKHFSNEEAAAPITVKISDPVQTPLFPKVVSTPPLSLRDPSSLAHLPKKVINLLSSAKLRRDILERRLSAIYNDADLSIPERFLQVEMGWKGEVARLAIYIAVPLGVFTMSNMPSFIERNQNNYRLHLYETTGVDACPNDPESIDDIRSIADSRPRIFNLHRINRQKKNSKDEENSST